ncbi:TPA: hypothetical protein EYP38_03745, partial [Candidatus Micrarchaeota archaeon]|nr:hypothetical protein [Candidatus Micrarchaeota archaeon]
MIAIRKEKAHRVSITVNLDPPFGSTLVIRSRRFSTLALRILREPRRPLPGCMRDERQPLSPRKIHRMLDGLNHACGTRMRLPDRRLADYLINHEGEVEHE